MGFVRRIGRWALAALVVNAIVGSGVFGNPADFVALLGRASVVAVIVGGLATGIIVACFAEVASKFTEPGGAYVYARTVFGRFVGIQVGWFSWLTRLSSAAASAALFVSYLGEMAPTLEFGAWRIAVLTLLLGLLTAANYIGVRSGANVSSVFAVAKITPLLVLGIYGLTRVSASHVLAVPMGEILAPGVGRWFEAMLLASFLYGGCDTAMMPLGEVDEPKRSVPFALAMGLLVCIVVFTLIQMTVLGTIGHTPSTRPLAQVASVFFGPVGAILTSVAAMVSTYGYLAASTLSVPRLTYALAEQGDFPKFFERVHPVFKTPHVSILIFGILTWTIAATGSFRMAVGLSVGARLITYLSTCAAVIPLRRKHPERKGFTVPFAPALSIIGCAMALALITRVHLREAIVMGITASIAAINWCWLKTRKPEVAAAQSQR